MARTLMSGAPPSAPAPAPAAASTDTLDIRALPPADLAPIRHAVLWPSIPLDAQLMPYDFLPSTAHLGAFLSGQLVGCLTLTDEAYRGAPPTPPALPAPPASPAPPAPPVPARQVQLHKFAVLQHLQGQGIGRRLFLAAADAVRGPGSGPGHGPALFHFDARDTQRGFYERLGARVLDPRTFETRGPTGTAEPVVHVRMGMIV